MDLEKLPEPEFRLRVSVQVKRVGFKDLQSRGESQSEDDMVFLVPDEGTSRDMMFSRFLPDVAGVHVEFAAYIPSPVSGLARVALMRRDARSPEAHYLFVMSKGAEEDLKLVPGKTLEVHIFGEEHDALLDQMKDFSLAARTKF